MCVHACVHLSNYFNEGDHVSISLSGLDYSNTIWLITKTAIQLLDCVCLLVCGILLIESLCHFVAVDFFNQINMLYGTITEYCTTESCPVMSAGPKYVTSYIVVQQIGWYYT